MGWCLKTLPPKDRGEIPKRREVEGEGTEADDAVLVPDVLDEGGEGGGEEGGAPLAHHPGRRPHQARQLPAVHRWRPGPMSGLL